MLYTCNNVAEGGEPTFLTKLDASVSKRLLMTEESMHSHDVDDAASMSLAEGTNRCAWSLEPSFDRFEWRNIKSNPVLFA